MLEDDQSAVGLPYLEATGGGQNDRRLTMG